MCVYIWIYMMLVCDMRLCVIYVGSTLLVYVGVEITYVCVKYCVYNKYAVHVYILY